MVTKFTYNLGDRVRWTSAANGSFREKTGVIEEVVPPRQLPLCADLKRPLGSPRGTESYVVRVGRREPNTKGQAYWPLVSKLVKV